MWNYLHFVGNKVHRIQIAFFCCSCKIEKNGRKCLSMHKKSRSRRMSTFMRMLHFNNNNNNNKSGTLFFRYFFIHTEFQIKIEVRHATKKKREYYATENQHQIMNHDNDWRWNERVVKMMTESEAGEKFIKIFERVVGVKRAKFHRENCIKNRRKTPSLACVG